MLGLLQDHLESAIESALIPGTTDCAPEDRAGVNEDQMNWKLAELWIAKLSPKAISKAKVPLKRSKRQGKINS